MALTLTNTFLQLGTIMMLEEFSLSINKGEIKTIMGQSGCGKSTLLSWIAGSLDSAFTASGNIELDGQIINDIQAHKRQIGILFQDDLLFPHMTVKQNLLFALPNHLDKKERLSRIKEALDSVELSSCTDKRPHQLSGGQRVRIALIRTLLSQPKAILLDEPFSKLDSDLKHRIRQMVFTHIERVQVPALMVTHDIQDAEAAQGEIIKFPKIITSETDDNKHLAKSIQPQC